MRNLHDSNFLPCNLQDRNFQSCNLRDSNLLLCNLQDSDLLSCSLQGKRSLSCNLYDDNLLLCHLQGILEKWDPRPRTHMRDSGPGTLTWDTRPGTLHLGSSLKHSHPYISYMSFERLHGEEQFRSKKYLLGMTLSRAKLRLKSPPQKRNF